MKEGNNMDWIHIFTIVGTNVGVTLTLFLWCRHEAGEDRKIVNEDRRDIINLIREIQNEVKDMKKEFHSRILVLEDRQGG